MKLYIKKHIIISLKNTVELTQLYRELGIDYPKFFKMDTLSKLAFIASERLLAGEGRIFEMREDVAVVFFNRSSSLETDTAYQYTIQNNESYYPSPSLFVYTLPNICVGEIAIRNKFCGDTSFYLFEEFNIRYISQIVYNTFFNNQLSFALVGWVEQYNDIFDVRMALVAPF